MGKLETIQQKILQLDGGSFQRLCDAYLVKKGYENIVSLGSSAGTTKTTIGTPDSYFVCRSGSYIFVEYTTQQNDIYNKIKNDIRKCLDSNKTGIQTKYIEKILYFHTSSNISPKKDKLLKEMCAIEGVDLILTGIDNLSHELYFNYPLLCRDFLDIQINTNQIYSMEDFIRNYNFNKLVAPIDTDFVLRQKELNDIARGFEVNDIVILKGPAGSGKTRVALEFAKQFVEVNQDQQVLCISNNDLPIYDDLSMAITKNCKYLLIVDDANELSDLHHVISYLDKSELGYSLKIILTVRDYALLDVINTLVNRSNYSLINIQAFDKSEIKSLLEVALGIRNEYYIERIYQLSQGNARLSILAGRIAVESNSLESIIDVTTLYDAYYTQFMTEVNIFVDEDLLWLVGILSFFRAVHIDNIREIITHFHNSKVTDLHLKDYLLKLQDLEIINFYHQKAIVFTDQAFANYLLKLVFFDKKILSLSKLIELFFYKYQEKAIYAVNTLLNIFRNEELNDYVIGEIRLAWNIFKGNANIEFFDFVKVFFRANPTETLLLVQERIEKEPEYKFEDIKEIDFLSGKNYVNVNNEIIEILCGFNEMDELPEALDLFLDFYIKRPDLFVEFYHGFKLYFYINEFSEISDYRKQIVMLNKLIEFPDPEKRDLVNLYFIEVIKELLKLRFDIFEQTTGNSFKSYQVSLSLSDGVKKYRKLIWEYLEQLAAEEKYLDDIRYILESYGTCFEDTNFPVMEYDFNFIKSICCNFLPSNSLKNCLTVYKIKTKFESLELDVECLKPFFENEIITLYFLIAGNNDRYQLEGQNNKHNRKIEIWEYISLYGENVIERIIDFCSEFPVQNNQQKYFMKTGLELIFETIFEKYEIIDRYVEYYLFKNTPFCCNPDVLVDYLYKNLTDEEIYLLIEKYNFDEKDNWKYAYHCRLPARYVNNKNLRNLYQYLSEYSSGKSASFDICEFEKYQKCDETVLIKCSLILIEKSTKNQSIFSTFFSSMFFIYRNNPQQLIQKYYSNIELFKKIYFNLYLQDTLIAYHQGYLKELYIVDRSCIKDICTNLITKNGLVGVEYSALQIFFAFDDYYEIFNYIFDYCIRFFQYPELSTPSILESFLSKNQQDSNLEEIQDKWIRICIKESKNDEIKMTILFKVISQLTITKRVEYIKLLINENDSIELFEKIDLIPSSWSWSGSEVPIYNKMIDFLSMLLPLLKGIRYLKHKCYVENKIENMRKYITSAEVNEALEREHNK